MPWDMQRTAFAYMDAVDQLEGLTLKNDFLENLDEDGDGIVTYNEFGKKGNWGYILLAGGERLSLMAREPFGYLKAAFSSRNSIKHSDASMNPDGHTINHDLFLAGTFVSAYFISILEEEIQDPFQPGLVCGKGKWPSFKFARYIQIGGSLYGREFPNRVIFPSLYGAAFRYADLTQNNGNYAGDVRNEPILDSIEKYISAVTENKGKQLDFTFYVGLLRGHQPRSGLPSQGCLCDTSLVGAVGPAYHRVVGFRHFGRVVRTITFFSCSGAHR